MEMNFTTLQNKIQDYKTVNALIRRINGNKLQCALPGAVIPRSPISPISVQNSLWRGNKQVTETEILLLLYVVNQLVERHD